MVTIVTAREICKTYVARGSRIEVLKDVSLDLDAGTMTALVGRSGSGKSTLLQILGALSSPDSGTVTINGTEVGRLGSAQASEIRGRTIGFVFQAFNLIPHLTARQNVALPGRQTRRAAMARAQGLLAEVGLADRANHRPSELSAGEQQRVALARALINNPAVILADEPTGNLDVETERALLHLIRDVAAAGRAVLVVTHTDVVADAADVVLRMDSGHITRVGDKN